jgi:hypothetical protein
MQILSVQFRSAGLVQNTRKTFLQWNVPSTEEWRLLGYGTLWGLFTTDVSEEIIAPIFRIERIRKIGKNVMEATRPSETSVLTRPTRYGFPDDGILHSHRRERLKFYVALTVWDL